MAALRGQRIRQLEERMLMGEGWKANDLVFCKVDGDPLHPDHFSREFVRRVSRWELPKLSLHGLRHTCATLALVAGVHPKVVQERLGHANIAVTLDTYSHVIAGMQAEAAATVAEIIAATTQMDGDVSLPDGYQSRFARPHFEREGGKLCNFPERGFRADGCVGGPVHMEAYEIP